MDKPERGIERLPPSGYFPPHDCQKMDKPERGIESFIVCFFQFKGLGQIAKSIFSLPKLRNVGSNKQKSRFYQPPSPSEICRDVPARRSISVGWSWLPPGCCPLNSTANRMGGANRTIGGLSICTTS